MIQERPNVLILGGASGGIGRMLSDNLRSTGKYNLIDTFYSHEQAGSVRCDVRDPKSLAEAIDKSKPVALLDFAGIGSEGACKNNPQLAEQTNVEGTENIVYQVSKKGIPLLFPGTINEFSGYTDGTICSEDTPPLVKAGSIYGKTKIAAGEAVIKKCKSPYAFVRTDVLLGPKNGIVGLFEKNGYGQIRINALRFPSFIEYYSQFIQSFINNPEKHQGITHIISPEFTAGIKLVDLAEVIIKRFNLAEGSEIIYGATDLVPRSPGQAMPIYVDSKANELATENRIFTSLRRSL